MDSLTIRETFLRFFEERGAKRYASAPLIPNDPTVLLTIAGMVPFKPYFLGDAVPPTPRATSYQKCVRTNDIENVGRTRRHLSSFEMLGNFSFGDYFKRDAIRWAWELSVEHYGLDPDRIWATVYEDDDESEQLWLEETGIPAERIQRLGAADNYWGLPPGPGGPNSELYYDRGPAYGQEGGPAVDDERYLEYYNLVFMQDQLDERGTIVGELPAKNVDTGLGLERMAVLLQDVSDVFATDLFTPLISRAEQLSGVRYGEDTERDVSLRVVAEHARTSAFLIADGVLPSKEGRGYVLRRLLRRAVRHGQLLGMDLAGGTPLLVPMLETVLDENRRMYPELDKQRELVTRIAGAEERDFAARLRAGLERVNQEVERIGVASGGAPAGTAFSGEAAFELHDTFGFPVDLTAEIAEEAGLSLDRDRFDALMDEQRQRARAGAKKGGGGVPVEVYRRAAEQVGPTEFLGYEQLNAEATLGVLLGADGPLEGASEGDSLEVVLARTPFYAEGGGQVGDHGIIETETGRLRVVDTQHATEGVQTHRAVVEAGEVRPGQAANLVVDADRRVATARSHSATHILHATMKEVIGDHAQQAGSLVQPGRLRFDFPHFEPVSLEQLGAIERTINARVLRDPHVTTEVMPLDEARAAGAVANFGDKYGQVVRVVTIGEFSKELCGGTHVPSGATVGNIYLVREESIGSNTRRIEALTGADAYRYARSEMQVAEEIARLVDTPTTEAVARVQSLLERLRTVDKELAKARRATLSQDAKRLADEAVREDGLAVVVARVDGVVGDDLRTLASEIRGNLGTRGVVVVGTATEDGKAQLMCALTSDLSDAGVEARPILHPAAQVVGGGAGGRGDLAQAGGKNGAALDEALQVAATQARDAVRGVS